MTDLHVASCPCSHSSFTPVLKYLLLEGGRKQKSKVIWKDRRARKVCHGLALAVGLHFGSLQSQAGKAIQPGWNGQAGETPSVGELLARRVQHLKPVSVLVM